MEGGLGGKARNQKRRQGGQVRDSCSNLNENTEHLNQGQGTECGKEGTV